MDDHRDVMSYEGVEAMVYFGLQMGEPYISTNIKLLKDQPYSTNLWVNMGE